jgi:hypothetical protein
LWIVEFSEFHPVILKIIPMDYALVDASDAATDVYVEPVLILSLSLRFSHLHEADRSCSDGREHGVTSV